ncbi:hypothetical protein CBS101457_005617 [Exobasidium rhododendri]|nr:hypothetical protein CBS101457_005617 [Exobasidium rhododendri]
MDPRNLPKRTTPHFSLYQRECFEAGTKDGVTPPFNTHPDELVRLAKERLSAGGWSYAACDAGLGDTNKENKEAFKRYKIMPRMLVDTNTRDISTTIFGKKISAPIAFSPVGINKIYHPEGELPVARIAGELGLPYSLSTAGSVTIEDAAEHNKIGAAKGIAEGRGAEHPEGFRFFQLYATHDEALNESLLTRAHEAGFEACIMTLDTWQLAWRHLDISLSNYGFYRGIGTEIGLSDPVFLKKLQELGIDADKDIKAAGRTWIDQVWHGKAFSWKDITPIMEQWKRISGGKPFLLKGIQTVDDAKRSVEIGCDGIVVSNHAGRQVDGAIGSLDVLSEIVDAVGKQTEVFFDSGVRGGADVFKALALGAKLVMIGRLWIYGLSIQGEAGVRHVMKSLLADFDILMNVAGFRSIAEIDRSALRYLPTTSRM